MKTRKFELTVTVADQDADLLDRVPAIAANAFVGTALRASASAAEPALTLPVRPVSLIWDGPCAVTESHCGIAMGWYVDCDSAVCRDCAPAGFASGDYSEWPGFEGWEDPLAICNDDESDSVTHCRECGAVIVHDLTAEGGEYVKEAIAELISEPGSHTADVIAQWTDAYEDRFGDKDWADILEYAGISPREVVENLMVLAGARKYEPAPDNPDGRLF